MSSNEGGDDNLPAGIDAPVAAPSVAVQRCEVTGNPCGTDTWAIRLDRIGCNCATCKRWLAALPPTFMVAKPEEVVEFTERVRQPPGSITIVAVEPASTVTTAVKCEWENCQSPAVTRVRWRREKYNGREDTFDDACYCDGHASQAAPLGAMKVGPL